MDELNPAAKISNRRNAVTKPPTKPSKNLNTQQKPEAASDRVSLSQTSKVKASVQSKGGGISDVRMDLVNKYRNILENGSYIVKADEIADKIVQKIRENKNRVIL